VFDTNSIPNGYMRDQRGALIPVASIKEIDILRDRLVMDLVAEAQKLSSVLSQFKTSAMADIMAFVDLSAEKYDTKFGGTKGNISLMSFDGEYMVKRAISERIVFDERLQVAKGLIDECLREWTDGSRSEIHTVINFSFEVDKEGRINTDRILSLRRLNITDPKWLKAMEAISDSVQVAGSKQYIRLYRRNPDESYKQINLDMAAV
jgi:hypothetical protein